MTSPPPSWPLSWIARSHRALVFGRRARVLADALTPLIPSDAHTVLDIGCGDGTIASLLAQCRPGVAIEGVEVIPRPSCQVPCRAFDGSQLPFPDQSFDVCLFVDVLHHTTDVTQLLREAARVARSCVILKDHLSESSFDHATLRAMDWVGNRPHGVTLTYNYQSRSQWERHFTLCGLQVKQISTALPLYPFPFSQLFGRKLHFVAQLTKR
ncbi:MAG TPA: class I SAM-dependent methyltransferase [Candidatus Sulfotelmatobacter sp.]|jgi:SAM-dependent methyltransferase|nr:class I SAM-dependent methyltransferase [Candidatus Sulfotelmatobacter sp.]